LSALRRVAAWFAFFILIFLTLSALAVELLSQRPVVFVVNYMDGRENCLVIFEEEIVAAAVIKGAVKLLLIIS
jgi:hypothetical protein